eukprot:5664493-Amphidinium_carterae.1
MHAMTSRPMSSQQGTGRMTWWMLTNPVKGLIATTRILNDRLQQYVDKMVVYCTSRKVHHDRFSNFFLK